MIVTWSAYDVEPRSETRHRSLLDAPGTRARAGAEARELYARDFAWDIIARKLEEAVS